MSEYTISTSPSDWRNWNWHSDYLFLINKYKNDAGRKYNFIKLDGPIDVELGIKYCEWIFNTPEIMDIIYKRFFLGDYSGEIDGGLLIHSADYFAIRNGYQPVLHGVLASTYSTIEKCLRRGEPYFDPDFIRDALLKRPYNFQRSN